MIPRLLGEADRVKSGACTATVKLVVAVREPEVPCTVTVAVVGAAELVAVSVNTLLSAVGLVPQEAVTPLGRVDVIARVTLSVKVPASVTLIVVVLVPP